MIVYLRGFNSSPESHKAQFMKVWMEQHGLDSKLIRPGLAHWPNEAIGMIETELGRHANEELTFLGSSVGGFYATWLAKKYDMRAVLINPAIMPHLGLRSFLGRQKNLYNSETYELTEVHLAQLEGLLVPAITPERYLLPVETGDEVIDYREALAKYRGSRQMVVQGGNHTLRSFPEHIPMVLEFSGLNPG